MTQDNRLKKARDRNDRKEDYVFLWVLDSLGQELEYDEAKAEIHDISKRLDASDVNPPIRFARVHGPRKFHSRGFLEALNRCRDVGAVREERDQLRLTEFGEDFIDGLQDDLPKQFVDAVENALTSDYSST